MLDFSQYLNLPLIWSGLILTAIILYVLLDGFDLGVGILFPFAPSDSCRKKMMNSIAPFWDGNETWLVLGGGGMLAAFPLAYSILMPALYIPIILMLMGLIFRGVAFEFSFKAKNKKFWHLAFHFGSLCAAFNQGVILGAIVQGISVTDNAYSGGMFDWLSAFSITTGLALISGYIMLGSTWLIMKTTAITQAWAKKVATYNIAYIILFMAVISVWVPFLSNEIIERWFKWPNFLYLSPVPIATIVTLVFLYKSVNCLCDYTPFVLSLLTFVCGFIGLGISIWPWIVPRHVNIHDAAARPESLSLLLVAAVIVLPVILFYVGYCYYVFRGKTKDETTY